MNCRQREAQLHSQIRGRIEAYHQKINQTSIQQLKQTRCQRKQKRNIKESLKVRELE
jgi:hypothetical protein